MKLFIIVVVLSLSLQLVLAKSSDKTYPKKVKHSKPTKSPKSIIEEFPALNDEDKEFIKELDKQFKLHGDKIKIKIEQDNTTAKNPKRTIDGDLGYGNHNNVQLPKFQFTQPRFQIYPYSQRDIPPIPLHSSFNVGRFPFFQQSNVQIQPSRAYEIKETPGGGYQTFTPSNQPFRPFTPRPTNLPLTTYTTPAYPGSTYTTTTTKSLFPFTTPIIPSPSPYPTFGYSNYYQQPQPSPVYQPQIAQQSGEPLIVLRIPGPAKYATHLQALLQQYLEIRAAQYIKAFEEQEARVAQQQMLFRQQHQQYPETQTQSYHPLIQTTDYYKPGNYYTVPTPSPQAQQQQQYSPIPQAPRQQGYAIDSIKPTQIIPVPSSPFPQYQQQRPLQFSQPEDYSIPKAQPISQFPDYLTANKQPSPLQQFIVQKVPQAQPAFLQQNNQPESPDYYESKSPAAESAAVPQAPDDYLAPKPQEQQEQQASYEYNLESQSLPETEKVVKIGGSSPKYGLSNLQKPPEFSIENILRNHGYLSNQQQFSGSAGNNQQLTQSQGADQQATAQQDIDDEPELPEARHRPTYDPTPVPETGARGGSQVDENQQKFSYDSQEQIQLPGPATNYQIPKKFYGSQSINPPTESDNIGPTGENSPRLTHTQVRYNNEGESSDHSSAYPLPPIPSTTPRYNYVKPQQNYETAEQDTYRSTEEPIVSITQKQRTGSDPGFSGYNSHQSLLETNFQGDAPYTESQFKKLNALITRLKQRSSPIIPTNSDE